MLSNTKSHRAAPKRVVNDQRNFNIACLNCKGGYVPREPSVGTLTCGLFMSESQSVADPEFEGGDLCLDFNSSRIALSPL